MPYLILLILLKTSIASAKEISFKAYNVPKKHHYGVYVKKENKKYFAHIWKDSPDKFVKKKISKSLLNNIQKEFKKYKYEALLKKQANLKANDKNTDYRGIVEFLINIDGLNHQTKIYRFKSAHNYIEKRIMDWLNYYNARLIAPNYNKLKRLK